MYKKQIRQWKNTNKLFYSKFNQKTILTFLNVKKTNIIYIKAF